MTDEPRVASAVIETSCPPVEASQLVAQRLKLGDPGIELGGPAPDQVHHEATRRLAPVPKGDDLADLPEVEPCHLGGAHEPVAVEGVLAGELVAGLATPVGSEDADAYPTLDQAVARDEAERIAKLFKALPDPTRVQLLGLLRARPGGECGCDLTGPLGISQPSVSYHVQILHEAGLVTKERRGSWVIYRTCEERLADIRRAAGPAAGPSAPADPSP